MSEEDKEEAFLTEYEALCRKHGMYMSTCSCCGIGVATLGDWADQGHLQAGFSEEEIEAARSAKQQNKMEETGNE